MQFFFQVNVELLYFVFLLLECLIYFLTFVTHIIYESFPLLLSKRSVFAQNVVLHKIEVPMNLLSFLHYEIDERCKS